MNLIFRVFQIVSIIAITASLTFALSFQEIEKKAKNGDLASQKELADIYYKDLPKNDEEAFKWYTAAGKQGDLQSFFMVGYMLFQGEGVIQNYTKALDVFQ